MATIFSETLVRLRKEAGFQTAYRFFHDNGGAQVFKVSYRNYLMMEQGRNLPVLARVARLLVGLRSPVGTPAARELTLAWLRTMAGEEYFGDLLEPLMTAGHASAASPAEVALKRALAEKKFHISEEQMLCTLASYEAYKCYFVIENDDGAWTPEALAKTLGIRKGEADSALKAFLKAGLVSAEGRAYRSRIAGKLVEYPAAIAITPRVLAKLKEYVARAEGEGAVEYSNFGLIRADSAVMRGYLPLIKANIEASHAFATTKKTRKSAGYLVTAKVHRLWNF